LVVEVIEPPFGFEVTVVVDVPEPAVPWASATPAIKPRAAAPANRCLIIDTLPAVALCA
jgi:hypothetical protein